MFNLPPHNPPDDHNLPEDARLTDALRSLPVPTPPADFDDRVLAALRVPVPWWQRLTWRGVWQPAQPLLLGTSCSLGLTLLLLHLTLSGPVSAPLPLPAVQSADAPAVQSADAPAAPLPPLDALLDRPNLRAGSLAAWSSVPAAEEAEPGIVSHHPEPRRRAEVYRRPALVA